MSDRPSVTDAVRVWDPEEEVWYEAMVTKVAGDVIHLLCVDGRYCTYYVNMFDPSSHTGYVWQVG